MGTITTTRNFISKKEQANDAKIAAVIEENNKLHLKVIEMEKKINELEKQWPAKVISKDINSSKE